jgi:putative addiction module antidote
MAVDTRESLAYYYKRYNFKVFCMYTLKLTQIGNSVGAVFPKELLAQLKLEKGDTFYVTESPEGLRITPNDPDFEAQMRLAREIMKERRNVLHELAK